MSYFSREDEQLASRLYDLMDQYERSGRISCTGFLTPSQQKTAVRLLSAVPFCLEAPFEHSERAVVNIGCDVPDEPGYHVLKTELNPMEKGLKHPDLLGALLHLGLKREVLGDLIVKENEAYIVCRPQISEFIMENLVRIGRQNTAFFRILKWPDLDIERLCFKINTSGMRLDAIVAALAKCSRSKAAELISQGLVKVNDSIITKNRNTDFGDIISIRKAGRFRLLKQESTTRKNRLVISVEQYQ